MRRNVAREAAAEAGLELLLATGERLRTGAGVAPTIAQGAGSVTQMMPAGVREYLFLVGVKLAFHQETPTAWAYCPLSGG